MILPADLFDDGGISLLAGHNQRRIARQQMLQREDQDRDEEQRRDQLNETLREEVQHGANCYFSFKPTTRTRPSGICL
jgi:hypothetical protein